MKLRMLEAGCCRHALGGMRKGKALRRYRITARAACPLKSKRMRRPVECPFAWSGLQSNP
jgi:hypothetical protein